MIFSILIPYELACVHQHEIFIIKMLMVNLSLKFRAKKRGRRKKKKKQHSKRVQRKCLVPIINGLL